jgi:hypothetical protein
MADFDEKVAFDTIKDSMGLTDQDLGPENDTGLTEDTFDQDTGDTESQEPSYESHEQAISDPDTARERPRTEPRQDPLKQNTLKFDPRSSFRQDKKGNLVDSKTGEIIARAGSEARIYQRVHKQAGDYIQAATRNIQNQVQAERGKLERAVQIGLGFEQELQKVRGQVQQLNAYELGQDQLLEAAQYYKQAQTDPVGVLKNLLTRAALNGIDITQLGMPAGGIDAKGLADMVKREIGAAVGPLQQYTAGQQRQQEQKQTESQYLQQAERQVNSFFTNMPEAVPYTHIFHAVLSQPQFQNMSLGAIWDKIQLHLMKSGVDPRRAPSRSQRQRLSGPPAQQRSLPNGQGMAPSGSDTGRRNNAGPAHPGMSYDAIIREVLGTAR